MWKLIAALFVVTNGVPADEPAHVMSFNHAAFETAETCMEFLGTEDGRAAVAAIRMQAAAQGIVVRFACIQAQDNTI